MQRFRLLSPPHMTAMSIAVQAGTYVNDFATISNDITIVGVGGMANFVAWRRLTARAFSSHKAT
jgi:hypothetical protein